MNTTLVVEDPLAGREVTMGITLAASHYPRDERPVLVSVGVTEQLPVLKTGRFSELYHLIDEAWTAFGVRAQAATAVSESEIVAEAQVVATTNITDEEPAPTLSSPLATPQPQAKNLSLF